MNEKSKLNVTVNIKDLKQFTEVIVAAQHLIDKIERKYYRDGNGEDFMRSETFKNFVKAFNGLKGETERD